MGEALIIFKAINSEHQKQMLLHKLLTLREEVTFKDKQDRSLTLTTYSLTADGHLQFPLFQQGEINFKEIDFISASFTMNGERYLFESKPVVRGGVVCLPIQHFCHLQRRNHFRYVLPEHYHAQFAIKTLNESPSSFSCRLVDLSTEGCGLEASPGQGSFKPNDSFTAEIRLGDYDPIFVSGVIKNVRPGQVLGVRFNHLDSSSEHQIITTITDIQRELYFRKAG